MNLATLCLAAALTIVYPGLYAHLPAVSRSFVFGASPAGSSVTVNGVAAHSAADGGWIAYVPFAPGDFAINVRAVGSRVWTTQRIIHVDAPLTTTASAPAAIDESLAPLPADDLVVRAGDEIQLRVKGSSDARVKARVGAESVATLTETAVDGVRGIYVGEVRLPKAAREAPMRVRYTLRAPDGGFATLDATGTVTLDSSPVPRIGMVVLHRTEDGIRPYGVVMQHPGEDWFLFPPVGTPFTVEGSEGDFYRVAVGQGQFGHINKEEIRLAPTGESPPSSILSGVDVADQASASQVTVRLSSRVPFSLAETTEGAGLKVTFFNTTAVTSSPTAYGGGAGVSRIARLPTAPGSTGILVSLRQHCVWGYHAAWAGNDLVISIKKPPRMAPAPAPALRGLLVVVDPGHSPDAGAIGPLGTEERVVNLAIAKRLAVHLDRLGARTLLTRYDESGRGLYDRTGLATSAGADVLISVHNNAWPDGVDPADQLGYSVYYHRRESLDLAAAIHAAYARDTELPDAGIFRADFALVRPTEQPSVLTESAFITWPDEEQLLLSPAFVDRLGATLADGLERWAEARRNSP